MDDWMFFFSASNCQSKKFYIWLFLRKDVFDGFCLAWNTYFLDQIRGFLGHDMFLLHPTGVTEWCLCNTARKTAGNVDAAAPKASERSLPHFGRQGRCGGVVNIHGNTNTRHPPPRGKRKNKSWGVAQIKRRKDEKSILRWLMDGWIDWLIDWLIDWWMDGWIDWLIDWLID